MARGLARGGEKLRTPVRRALKEQTSVKRYGMIVANTRGWLDAGGLQYTIEASALRKPDQVNASTDLLSAWLQSNELQLQIGDEDSRTNLYTSPADFEWPSEEAFCVIRTDIRSTPDT